MTQKTVTLTIVLFFLTFGLAAQYQVVSSNGLDIHYRIVGKGEPILIIGGGPGDDSNRYLSLCEVLSPQFQCILVDQRGTGKSMPAKLDETTISIALTVKDFEALRQHLGFREWLVLGFSYGGYLAAAYAQEHPASISRLILLGSMGLNTRAFGHFLDNINAKLLPSDLALVEYWNDPERMKQNRHHAIVEQIRARMPGYFFDRNKSLIVSQAMKDKDFNFELGRWLWPEIQQNDLSQKRCNFTKPVLILHGRQDPLGESVPQSIQQFFPKAELVFIEKCGHYSWIEQPEKVLSSIKKFGAGTG